MFTGHMIICKRFSYFFCLSLEIVGLDNLFEGKEIMKIFFFFLREIMKNFWQHIF